MKFIANGVYFRVRACVRAFCLRFYVFLSACGCVRTCVYISQECVREYVMCVDVCYLCVVVNVCVCVCVGVRDKTEGVHAAFMACVFLF